MWVFPAGARAGFVDGAVVVRAKERAGRYVQHIISIIVEVEVVINKAAGFYTQVSCQAVYVDVPEDRTGRFTAVGAIQTVDFLKDFFVEIVKALVQVFGRAGLQLTEELFIGLAFVLGLLNCFFYVHAG